MAGSGGKPFLSDTPSTADPTWLRETAVRLGFTTTWDPAARLITVTNGPWTATLNPDTRATSMEQQGPFKVIQAGNDFLVDWLFFVSLTGKDLRYDSQNQIIIFRPL